MMGPGGTGIWFIQLIFPSSLGIISGIGLYKLKKNYLYILGFLIVWGLARFIYNLMPMIQGYSYNAGELYDGTIFPVLFDSPPVCKCLVNSNIFLILSIAILVYFWVVRNKFINSASVRRK